MNKRQKLLGLLVEADIEATEAGIADSPMSRLHAEYIVDRLLEAGVLATVKRGKEMYAVDPLKSEYTE